MEYINMPQNKVEELNLLELNISIDIFVKYLNRLLVLIGYDYKLQEDYYSNSETRDVWDIEDLKHNYKSILGDIHHICNYLLDGEGEIRFKEDGTLKIIEFNKKSEENTKKSRWDTIVLH